MNRRQGERRSGQVRQERKRERGGKGNVSCILEPGTKRIEGKEKGAEEVRER